MPELSTSELVRQIHTAAGKMVVAMTGGGSRAIAELLEVPGGSRTVLEAIVPYSAESLVEFLGGKPEQFCSARTARAMAMAGFQRGRALSASAPLPPAPLLSKERGESSELLPVEGMGKIDWMVGVGCTASLASDRPKRGPHRIHVALQTADTTSTHSLELEKGRRCRVEEESIATRMVLNTVAESFGLKDCLTLPLLASESVETVRTIASQSWQDLLLGMSSAVSPSRLPQVSLLSKERGDQVRVIFPGAFNPLHDGHRRMAEIATRQLNAPVHFEISVQNVDKLPLDYTEMQERAAQFDAENLPLWFTRAPTFEEKSAIFPGAIFIVGVDTLVRIGQPCYYHNNPVAAEQAIDQIANHGCRFLVFGRLVGSKFETLDSLPISASLRKLCLAVSADEFRADVSSTNLRSKATLPID